MLQDVYYGSELEEARKLIAKVQEEVVEAIDNMKPHKAFFNKTGALTKKAFFSLKGEFSRWALTKLLPIEVMIADQIDPRVYGEVAALMMGQREEEVEVEGSVDQGKRHNKV